MKRIVTAVSVFFLLFSPLGTAGADYVLEPWTYTEDFEERLLGAWASYPLWQDTAYDPNIRPNTIVPGDPNLSLEQRVTPYTNVDNYCGAQKLLDMYVVPGSSITLRYYLKSHLPFEYLKVRLAAGPDGAVDYTFANPKINDWEWITVTYDDFIRENPSLAAKDRIKVNALAVLAKVPNGDPDMPFYFGLDDITFQGARAVAFRFEEPAVEKLPDYKPYIPLRHYVRGENFTLRGSWPVEASRVQINVVSFTDRSNEIWSGELRRQGNNWVLGPMPLNWDEGLYLATMTAVGGSRRSPSILSDTEFTIHVAPRNVGKRHPRIWFDEQEKRVIETRLGTERFSSVLEGIVRQAANHRERMPVESLVYDLDQYPDENWLPSWSQSGAKIMGTGEPLQTNALAYAFGNDRVAGEYAKDVLLRLADYPTWHHPWQIKRGRFADHRTGGWSHRLAIAYDLVYDLMTEQESAKIRNALMEQIVKGAYLTYVWDNNITSNTSNWLAMITGGSMMVQTAIWGDGPDVENLEPYFTGTALKLWAFLEMSGNYSDAYGEGWGYHRYSVSNLQRSLPGLNRVFNIDMHKPIANWYKELIWQGFAKDTFYMKFGDSGTNFNGSGHFWLWLLEKTNDPLLSWFINNTKASESFEEVRYAHVSVPMKDPFTLNPNYFIREVGTTIFKSGWETDDFVFVFRCGPFYNHHHIDQGTFWLADRGTNFIQERTGSTYYDDSLYQSWYTQPISKSTILINDNHQSQRVGDIYGFAHGFEDYATTDHWLDGEFSSFAGGNLGPLYWGEVKDLERNVLFIKPRTVILLDTVTPVKFGTAMTMLFQPRYLKDIIAGQEASRINIDGNTLNILHLTPANKQVDAVKTPHYLNTLLRQGYLEQEGMLTVRVETDMNTLVAANLLTTTPTGIAPQVDYRAVQGAVVGNTSGVDFAFSTRPGFIYNAGDIATDAVALTWRGSGIFAARCTSLTRNGRLVVSSNNELTCEIAGNTIRYYHCEEGEVSIGVASRPSSVTVNGSSARFNFEAANGLIKLTLPAGEGTVVIR